MCCGGGLCVLGTFLLQRLMLFVSLCSFNCTACSVDGSTHVRLALCSLWQYLHWWIFGNVIHIV